MFRRELGDVAWNPDVRQSRFATGKIWRQRRSRARFSRPEDDLSITHQDDAIEPELRVVITRVNGLPCFYRAVGQPTHCPPNHVCVVIFAFAINFSARAEGRFQEESAWFKEKWRGGLL